MIAPLHDDKGNVKYHIGAQVDVTGLVTRAKGLDGFEKYLFRLETQKRAEQARGRDMERDNRLRKPRALGKLRELSEMFDLEESAVVRSHSRSASTSGDEDDHSVGSSRKSSRRYLEDQDDSESESDGVDNDPEEDRTWVLGHSGRSGLSGKLPGVYETFMLIRPTTSQRIIFASPTLRRRLGNVLQHPFLSHIAASSTILKGLKDSFGRGEAVSAKVNFLLNAGKSRDGTAVRPGSRLEDAGRGRICWISATPLVGSDEKIGVWMIVVVEKAKVPTKQKPDPLVRADSQLPKGSARSQRETEQQKQSKSTNQQNSTSPRNAAGSSQEIADQPIKPHRLEEKAEPIDYFARPSTRPGRQKAANMPETLEDPIEGRSSLDPRNQNVGNSDESSDLNQADVARPVPRQQSNDSQGDLETAANLPSSVTRDTGSNEDTDSHPTEAAKAENGGHANIGETEHVAQIEDDSPEDEDDLDDKLDVANDVSDEDTVRIRDHDEDLDLTPPRTRPGPGALESKTDRSKSYMDYLRHPGSLPAAEHTRNMSGNFLSGVYESKEDADGGGDFSGIDPCVRSPYSVD
jgi:hypothetical protein